MNHDLVIPKDWIIIKNDFNDEEVSADFPEEDILLLKKQDVCLDVGWYGGSEGRYILYLFRGNWLKGELLEKYSSSIKWNIRTRIYEIFKSIDEGVFVGVEGIKVDQESSENGTGFDKHEDFALRTIH